MMSMETVFFCGCVNLHVVQPGNARFFEPVRRIYTHQVLPWIIMAPAWTEDEPETGVLLSPLDAEGVAMV